MPLRRGKRIKRQTLALQSVKHSDTDILTIGSASIPTEIIILDLEGGARTTDGSTKDIASHFNTASECQVGAIVKYINLFIQAGVRPAQASAGGNNNLGWIEWALVMCKRTETTMPITNVGVKTIGDIATKMYRNECIYTGLFPISRSNSNAQSISIKVPKFKTKLVDGDEWRLYVYYRDLLSTAVGTDTCRAIVSRNFKSYQ